VILFARPGAQWPRRMDAAHNRIMLRLGTFGKSVASIEQELGCTECQKWVGHASNSI
jgi:hypothetical protein